MWPIYINTGYINTAAKQVKIHTKFCCSYSFPYFHHEFLKMSIVFLPIYAMISALENGGLVSLTAAIKL